MNEQQKETAERVEKFKAGLEKLMKEHFITMKAQITPDGPIINLMDTRYNVPPMQTESV